MDIRIKTTAFLGAAALGLAACAQPGDNNVPGAAAIGAAAGAVAGNVLSDGDRGSTIVGGLVGAGLGAAVGNQLNKQQAALEEDIGDSGARIINTGDRLIVSLPEAITFPVDSSTVRGTIRDDVAAIAQNLQEFPNNTVQVIGHTDTSGSSSYNQRLSARRAAAVTAILQQNGVQSGRIVSVGRGESQPVQSNATASGRQANRRVEIVITPTV